MDLTFIDPESNSDVSYHATDVRRAIIREDEVALADMLPPEIIEAVRSQVAREIAAGASGQGRAFIPGKQTVDVVFLCREDDGDFILMGNRCAYKRDFAGYPSLPGGGIFEHESALDAAVRVLRMETGIACAIDDRATFPMPLHVEHGLRLPARMEFVNIFSSPDMEVNGTMGGASRCFLVTVSGGRERLEECLYSRHDLEDLRWIKIDELPAMEVAYEQKNMIYEALVHIGIPCPEECFDVLSENGRPTGRQVTRHDAHKRGVLHGTSHVCIWRKRDGETTEILLQKRSDEKDSFPGCYDLASAGHCVAGTDFLETALQELSEELGLDVEASALAELTDWRISGVNRFHGEIFHNEEICRVYALEADVEPSDLTIQVEELSEVRWFPLACVLEHVRAEDPLFCMNREEFLHIAEILTRRLA